MAVTNNESYAHTMRMLRDWGQERKYHHDLKGFNYRMAGFQGACLRVKLSHLDAWTERRREHAASYHDMLARTVVGLPQARDYARHVYHLYAVRAREREALQVHLATQGIQTGIHYPIPVHLQKAYADLGYAAGDFPSSEEAAGSVLSLPMFAELSDIQIELVAKAIGEFA